MFRVRANPLQDFAVAFGGGQLSLERFGIETQKGQNMLIQGAVVVIFTVFGCQSRAAFVEHSRQEGITAQPTARTSRGTLSEVCCRDVVCVHSFIFLSVCFGYRSGSISHKDGPKESLRGPVAE